MENSCRKTETRRETGVGKILWKLDYLHGVPRSKSLGETYVAHATLGKVIPFVIHENTQRGILLVVILPSAKLSSFLSGKARKRFD